MRPAAGALPTTATATPVRPVKKAPKRWSRRRAHLTASGRTAGIATGNHRPAVPGQPTASARNSVPKASRQLSVQSISPPSLAVTNSRGHSTPHQPDRISQLPGCRRPVAVMRRASLAYSNADTVGLTPDRHRSPVRDAADRVRCLQRRSYAHRWGIDAACWKGHYQLKSDNCYADHATLAITPGCRTPRKVGLLGGPGLSTLRGPRAVAPRRRWRRPASSER